MENNKMRSRTVIMTNQIKNQLDDLVKKGGEINREKILLAEKIEYKNTPTERVTYDSFGFVDKFDRTDSIKK